MAVTLTVDAADQDELYDVVPVDARVPHDVHEVITRIVDGGNFTESAMNTVPTLVTGFARIHGHPVGIIANNGVLFGESVSRCAFHRAKDKRKTPLLFPAEHPGPRGNATLRGGRHSHTAPRWSRRWPARGCLS